MKHNTLLKYALATLIAVNLIPIESSSSEEAESRSAAQVFELEDTIEYDALLPAETPMDNTYTQQSLQKDFIDALQSIEPLSSQSSPGVEEGQEGSGLKHEIELFTPSRQQDDNQVSYELGKTNIPFSSARADLSQREKPVPTNRLFPYSAVGKLRVYELEQGRLVLKNNCSASLIKRGLILTAAHCVAPFGSRKVFSRFKFVPGYRSGDVAPFFEWAAARVAVDPTFVNGTAACVKEPPGTRQGIKCPNDLAMLTLRPLITSSGQHRYAADFAGFLGVGWGRWGFSPRGFAHVTQLGYPGCLDGGELMQRTDAQAVISRENAYNTTFGSLMCGGASGGPVIVNFGVRPILGKHQTNIPLKPGAYFQPNVIIGVGSWYNENKIWGASPITKDVYDMLFKDVCRRGSDPACSDVTVR